MVREAIQEDVLEKETMKEDVPGKKDNERGFTFKKKTIKEDALGKGDHEGGCT